MRSIKGQLLEWLPRSAFLYRFCKLYADRYNGENNDNIFTNGELRLMRTILPHCNIVFDIGANIGDWAALALDINPSLRIHCFEPSQATFQRLMARNFKECVTCNNLGLSSTLGEKMLYIFDNCAGINSLYKRHGLEDGWGLQEQQHTETVQLDTLDAYCERAKVQVIDFMKVDVEGHELEVFKGGVDMLRQGKIKHIQFEYGGCNIDARMLLKDIFDFFAPYGYVFYKIFPHELRHVPRYDLRLENFQYQNWVAMAKEAAF